MGRIDDQTDRFLVIVLILTADVNTADRNYMRTQITAAWP